LRVQGAFHSALMTGDIAMPQEDAMVARGDLTADVVMAAHHGSKGSSSPAFVTAVRAAHVVAQAGYLNSYRHPHPSVVARWQDAGAVLHRSDRDGAVVFTSGAEGLKVVRERERRRRYWHGS
jgi:competence protein ComEC